MANDKANAAKFTKAFGEKGALWYLEGRTFDDCTQLHLTQLTVDHHNAIAKLTQDHATKLGKLQSELAAVQKKLTALGVR